MGSQTLVGLAAEFQNFLLEKHPRIGSERMMGVPFQETVKKALKESDDFFMKDASVNDFIMKMVDLMGFDAPLMACVEYAARRTNERESLPKGNPVILGTFYDKVVLPCMQAQNKMLGRIVFLHLDLNKTERLIMLSGYNIGLGFDALFAKWWKWVTIPYRQGLEENDKLKDSIKESKFKDHYSILVKDDGSFIEEPLTKKLLESCQEKPLALVFPEEIRFIRANLLYVLENLHQDQKAYRDYFNALYRALGNVDLSSMEDLWTEVDLAWVRIGREKRVVPVHMMEWGYHHPVQISPEYRVSFRLTDYSDEISLMRKAMEQYGINVDGEVAKARLDGIDVGAFFTVVNGGQGIDFRFAGQSVPNRPKAQAKGMKIFIDLDSMDKRLARFKSLLKSCLSEETLSWALLASDLDLQFCAVTSHELAHPLLITENLLEVFGTEKPKFEETKATLFGIIGIQNAIKENSLDQSVYLKLSAYLLGDIIRRLEKHHFEDPTMKPYTNTAMTLVTVLIPQGLLTIQNEKLHMDKEIAGSDRIINALIEVSNRLVRAYKDVDLDGALKVVTDFAPGLDENNIAAVYWVVNKNLHPN